MDRTPCRTMLNSGLYAGRKRSRPRPKMKPTPLEGVKTNPSKRHRERLNTELDTLARLLPFSEDIINKLDKLSVLRLSVSYLRVKNFFGVAAQKQKIPGPKPLPLTANGYNTPKTQQGTPSPGMCIPEGELLLQALNGFVLVVTVDGTVFYTSSTVQDYLGFHQSDLINHNVFDLIHTEDREEFRRQLHWALNPTPLRTKEEKSASGDIGTNGTVMMYQPNQLPPENSSFLDRNFLCRFRCLLDSSSGFLALHFHGKLKFLHGQNKKTERGTPLPPQLALFAIAIPVQPPAIMEIRTRSQMFRTKHKMDFTPMGVDSKGKLVLGWTEAELKTRSGYQYIHIEDMMHCAENHIRMLKTGDSGSTIFRLLTKQNRWIWVHAIARVVYKDGQPDYIIATQRPLTDAEGEEHLQKRIKCDKFPLSSEAVLYDGYSDLSQSFCAQQITMKKELPSPPGPYDHSTLIGAMMSQDEKAYEYQPPETLSVPMMNSFLSREHADGIQPGTTDKEMDTEGQKVRVLSENSQTVDIGLDCGILEMLKKYGLSQEDLELMQEDEIIKKIDINDFFLSPEEILSMVESLALSSNPSCSAFSSSNHQHHLHASKWEVNQSKVSGSTWATSLHWNCREDVSQNSAQLYGQLPPPIKQDKCSLPSNFTHLPVQPGCESPCSSMSKSNLPLDWQFPNMTSPVDQQVPTPTECYTPYRTEQTSALSRQLFQNDPSVVRCNGWDSQTVPEQSAVNGLGIMSPTVTASPLLDEQNLLSPQDIMEQNQLNCQPPWTHLSSSPSLRKSYWPMPDGNPQESDTPSTFLPTGVRTLLAPEYNNNLLCRGFSWGSVQ